MAYRSLIHVLGVPLDLGAGRRGVDMGPSAFRIAGLVEHLRELGLDAHDQGDVRTPIREAIASTDPARKFAPHIATVCRDLYERSLQSLTQGAVPIVLGGDHSIAAGSVSATAAAVKASTGLPLGLLWVDAHGDMNTPETTPSGNVHGMPLAALLGGEPRELTDFSPRPVVKPEHTVLLGLRDLDARERTRILASGVHVFTMTDIDRNGIAAVAEQALAIVTAHTGGVHVSFDMDVCDPTIAPGVGTPVRGGLDYREAHLLMELVAASGRVSALDLVEVNPTLDIRNTTAELGVELALSALGKRIL